VGHAHDPYGPSDKAGRLPGVQRFDRGLRADAVGLVRKLAHTVFDMLGLMGRSRRRGGELVEDQDVHGHPLDRRGGLDCRLIAIWMCRRKRPR
jgi:hypothetical protein